VKFFYIDYHISVIADLKEIFGRLGHTVDGISLSGHAKITGEKNVTCRIPIKSALPDVFKGTLADDFYAEYKDELKNYDGFICTYPPAMAAVFKKFNKPTILHIPIRYEYPFFADCYGWQHLNELFSNMAYEGLLIPVANNKYDQYYYNAYVDGANCKYVSSWCGYTGMRYSGKHKEFLYSAIKEQPNISKGTALWKERLHPSGSGYKWSEIEKYRGIVHIPYNVSTMSLFEQYAANIPLFFPSAPFLMDLTKRNVALSQISWLKTFKMDPKETGVKLAYRDLNDYENYGLLEDNIMMSDFYQADNMPHITYFDSWENLGPILKKAPVREISAAMEAKNVLRKQEITDLWDHILKGIK